MLPIIVDTPYLNRGPPRGEAKMVSNGCVKRSPMALIPCKNFPWGKMMPRSRNSKDNTRETKYDQMRMV